MKTIKDSKCLKVIGIVETATSGRLLSNPLEILYNSEKIAISESEEIPFVHLKDECVEHIKIGNAKKHEKKKTKKKVYPEPESNNLSKEDIEK